ncbi:hypothetical protein FOZ62_016169, partial [Perkinsus olseni]
MVGNRSPDYEPPEACRRLWKEFGTNTEAGRHLRALYSSAEQYNAYQSIKYPPIKTLRKAPQLPSKPLAAPKSKARIQVPRVGGRFASGGSEKSPPNKGIKSKSRIEEELKKSRPVDVVLPPGRDVEAEKDRLAELNQFAGGALGLPKVSSAKHAGAGPIREKTKPDGAGAERDRMVRTVIITVAAPHSSVAALRVSFGMHFNQSAELS